MNPALALPQPNPNGTNAEAGFKKVFLQLVKRGPERRAIEMGQIDAIMDPESGKAILLPAGYRGITRTIPKHLQPEETLLKAGALQNAIFNSTNFSSIATDAKGVIQIFNVGAERMLGYAAAEVLNQITPADISDPQEMIVRAKALSVELGTPITPGFEALVFKASRGIEDIYELTYIRKDGSRFPAVVSVTALRDAHDAIIGYLLIGTDNTARKQAEEALLKAWALQSAIFNSANFSSIATDAKGVIQIFNVGAERMLGYTAAEVMNQITPADISDPQEVIARATELSVELGTPIMPGFEALVFKASRGIEDIYELTYIRKDGSRFPAAVSVTALRDAQNVIIGYLLISTDNTARKQAAEVIKDNDRRKDEFLATLAHELRNPLAPISNSLHLLRLSGGNEPIHEILERQVKHIVRLVDDLMEVSRISRGKIELRRERIDLVTVVKHALETAQPLIEAGGQRLSVVLPPAPLVLDADPVRLTQVLTNLLENAAKYTPADGSIWLTVRGDGDQAAISVRDNGAGIPAAMLSHVFEMFTQVDRTLNRAQGGLGIGLSLVHRLVAMHGGQVTARSDGQNRGSEFIVRLPLAEALRNQEPAADSFPIPHSGLRTAQSVLVVDDNRDAADSLGLLLKLLGTDVQVAHSGASALAALESFRPAVVLLDLGMPGMDGYEVARRMRETCGAPLTLIALTGWGQEEDRRRTHAAGFDHHLTKPPELAALQALLASL